MSYMSYGDPTPNQSGANMISPMSMSKGGSCCGSKAPITPTPFPAQQMPQSVMMQSMHHSANMHHVGMQHPFANQPMPIQPLAMQQPLANQPMPIQPLAMQQPLANQPMPIQPLAMQKPLANQPMPMQSMPMQPMAMQQPVAMQQTAAVTPPGAPGTMTSLPTEQSFIENILRLNLGKVGTFYFTYENNSEWNAKIFRGKIEAAGRDHIILSDPKTGQRIMLLMVNFDYATFDEPLNYQYPFRQPVLESSEEEQ